MAQLELFNCVQTKNRYQIELFLLHSNTWKYLTEWKGKKKKRLVFESNIWRQLSLRKQIIINKQN